MNERVNGRKNVHKRASIALSLQVFSESEPSFSSVSYVTKFLLEFSILLELILPEMLFFHCSLSFVDEADFFELQHLSVSLQFSIKHGISFL